jgi:glycine oxidase
VPRCIFSSYNGRVKTADVIIAGGGIIGLSTALELAQKGFRVHVMERGRVMSEASWAAAGMLAAEDPGHPAELAKLAALSLHLYPEYLNTVERLSGRPVPLRTRAALQTSGNGGGFHHQDTATCFAISAQEAKRRIPGLAARSDSYLWLEEVSLDPRDLCAALPLAAVAAGTVLHEDTEVLAVNGEAGSVEIRTQSETVSAGAFVNCCGAWAGKVQHPSLQRPAAAVEPWKGQMMMVRLDPPLDLEYVLRTPEVYLVPRGGGQVAIGATVERVGFDRRVEPSAAAWLRALAAELWPPIGSAQMVESWTGLRPGTKDGLPLIGAAGEPHCWIATGHFRNGILLAPATGLILRQLLEGNPPEVSLDAFHPGR